MNWRILVICCLVAIGLSGCDGQKNDGSASAGPRGDIIKIREADAGLELARIGSHPVTCGSFRSRLDFERAFWKFRNPKKKDDIKALDSFTKQRLPRIIPELLNQAGVEAWMKLVGIPFSAAEIKAAESESLKSVGFKGTVADFARRMSCDNEFASRQLCAAARWKKACLAFEPGIDTVSEQEIDDGLARLSAYYDRAIASNAVTWAACSNVIAEIKRGLPFNKAAVKYSFSDSDEGEKWEDFLVSGIKNEALKAWARAGSIGEMKIFELDDGISIVKILERKEGVVARKDSSTADSEVTLARINFAMVEPEPEPRTREHVRTELLKWKLHEAQQRLGARIVEKFPVSYPNENAKIVL